LCLPPLNVFSNCSCVDLNVKNTPTGLPSKYRFSIFSAKTHFGTAVLSSSFGAMKLLLLFVNPTISNAMLLLLLLMEES